MSFITVSAEKVLTAANFKIDLIMKRRAEKDKQAIARQMTKGYFNLTYPFFHFYNEEQAKEKLSYTFGFPSFYAWGDLDRLEKLVILAYNGDPVNIDTDDADLLWG